jgi:putative endonuclease
MSVAFVYIVSNKSHTLYVGITTDLRERFAQHRNKTYPNGFTARYRFTRLVYFEAHNSLADAARREQELKSWPRSKKVALIQAENPNWHDLSPRLDPLYYLR